MSIQWPPNVERLRCASSFVGAMLISLFWDVQRLLPKQHPQVFFPLLSSKLNRLPTCDRSHPRVLLGRFFGVWQRHIWKSFTSKGKSKKRKQVWPLGDLGAPGWADWLTLEIALDTMTYLNDSCKHIWALWNRFLAHHISRKFESHWIELLSEALLSGKDGWWILWTTSWAPAQDSQLQIWHWWLERWWSRQSV